MLFTGCHPGQTLHCPPRFQPYRVNFCLIGVFSEPFPEYVLLLFESHLPTEYPPREDARFQPQTHQVSVFWGQTSVKEMKIEQH